MKGQMPTERIDWMCGNDARASTRPLGRLGHLGLAEFAARGRKNEAVELSVRRTNSSPTGS